MSEKYVWARGPWSSVSPSALSALDIGDVNTVQFRPTYWKDRPEDMMLQEIENDGAYLAFLESLPRQSFVMDQPLVKWRCSRPASLYTTNDYAVAAGDTYIELDDSMMAAAGRILRCPKYGTEFRVLDVDDDHSEGWVNGATNACNTYVELITGPSVAIPIGNVFHYGEGLMGEQGTPKRALTSTPGDSYWNTMQLVGLFDGITTVQQNANMVGGWGTHPKMRADVFYQHRYAKQQALLHGRRHFGTDSQGVEGQLWKADGIIPQIKSNIMSAGEQGVNLVYPVLNDFWEKLFDSELSDSTKHHFCDASQFRDIRAAAIQAGALIESQGVISGAQAVRITGQDTLGVPQMTVTLQSGMNIIVHLLRKAFSAPDMKGWGVTCDAQNIAYGTYNGISEQWYENIETPAQQITLRSDAIVDTWCTVVHDESTCGVIRGGVSGLIG